MNPNYIALAYVLLVIYYIVWDMRKRRNNKWKEIEVASKIIDRATKQKIARDAKKLEREAMEYKELPQKKIFRSKP